jgi:phage tail sheath protein FI
VPLSNYQAPGIYIEEVSSGARPIQAVGTSTVGFVGVAPQNDAFVNEARAINNWSEFLREFVSEGSKSTPLSHAVYGFFNNGGRRCYVVNVGKGAPVTGGGRKRAGLEVLESIDEIAIIAVPGFQDASSYEAALEHCERLKTRIAILDAPNPLTDLKRLVQVVTVGENSTKTADGSSKEKAAEDGGVRARTSPNGYGAFYFPWIVTRDPLAATDFLPVPPSGHIAGIYARTDAFRGVHKAPANEPIRGALNVSYRLTSEEQGSLNQNGVNCIRLFPRDGILLWGARTLADGSSPWRYVNVRRLFIMIEESIARSTSWVVFEPNDASLWKSIRRDVGAFLNLVWRDGALMGATPEEAYFVKCDSETNPQEVIDAGQVVILVGIAPVKPAEFVIFRIGQSASGVQSETL